MEPHLQWRTREPRDQPPLEMEQQGEAGHMSRPYKWVGFVGAAHSPAAPGVAICRGGW